MHGRVWAAGAALLEAAFATAAMATEDSASGLLGLGSIAFVGALLLPNLATRCGCAWQSGCILAPAEPPLQQRYVFS